MISGASVTNTSPCTQPLEPPPRDGRQAGREGGRATGSCSSHEVHEVFLFIAGCQEKRAAAGTCPCLFFVWKDMYAVSTSSCVPLLLP